MKKLFLSLAFSLAFLFGIAQCTCKHSALVTYVVDGDTFDANIHLGYKVSVEVRMRLAGLNAPEMKDTSAAVRAKAVVSKKYLTTLLLGQIIYIDAKEVKDKYGRYIETVLLTEKDSVSVNTLVIRGGYAVKEKY